MRDGASLPTGDIATEATAWFMRRRSGTMSEEAERDLRQWLATPACAEAFARVEQLWQGLEPLHDDPKLLRLREEARSRGRPHWFWRPAALAACAVGAVAAAVALFLYPIAGPPDVPPQHDMRFATAKGQRLPIALADGSSIVLDANSSVRVDVGSRERVVEIEQGRAFFQVAHDSRRPFVVRAGLRSVTAVGTAFSVDTITNPLDVVLVEGRVRVQGQPQEGRPALEMSAGSRLLVPAKGSWRASKVDTARSTAWLRGQLVFDNAPLSRVVAEINRYTERPVILAHDGTAEKRLSAVLNVNDLRAFTGAVEMLGLAQAHSRPDGTLVLRQNSLKHP